MKSILAGNWKMNMNATEVTALISNLKKELLQLPIGVEIIISPAYPFLASALEQCERTPLQVAAQNCHQAASGAYTGEVSVDMLSSLGIKYCIVGHSERRQYYNENDKVISEKIKALLAADITPIYCCGEQEEERTSGQHFAVVSSQMKEALSGLNDAQVARVIVAYEPVWAIGTGLTASAEQAQEMHAHIRTQLGAAASEVSILYGGSCKPSNANELFACKDVNGGLIGGAALKHEDFLTLVSTLHEKKSA